MTGTADPFAIEWAPPAMRALNRIPEKVATAAIEVTHGPMAERPHRVGHALRFELEELHSARRGDHRIVYGIDDGRHRVIILAIEHRADVYRGR